MTETELPEAAFRLVLRTRADWMFGALATLEVDGIDAMNVFLRFDGIEYSYRERVDAASANEFRKEIISVLRTHGSDSAWSGRGLDGATYDCSFHSTSLTLAKFVFWSPQPWTPPYRLASAAFKLVPQKHPDAGFESELAGIRKNLYLDGIW